MNSFEIDSVKNNTTTKNVDLIKHIAHDLITKATLINPNEPSKDHPDSSFRVYEYIDDCYRIEIKIKCNRDGNFMHIIRVYKK